MGPRGDDNSCRIPANRVWHEQRRAAFAARSAYFNMRLRLGMVVPSRTGHQIGIPDPPISRRIALPGCAALNRYARTNLLAPLVSLAGLIL